MFERRICGVLGQHQSTPRKTPRGADEEAALTEDIIALALQNGRNGHRLMTALHREIGWPANSNQEARLTKLGDQLAQSKVVLDGCQLA